MAQASQIVLASRTQPAVPSICPFVIPLGDSITYGVGSSTAGWRKYLYDLLAVETQRLYFVGSVSWAGGDGGLAVDPHNEGHPGYVVKAGPDQVPPLSFGSLTDASASANIVTHQAAVAILAGGTNDIATGVLNDSAADCLVSISTWLDVVWAYGVQVTPRFQIVLCSLLKRLDADDTKVQAVNAGLAAVIAGKAYAANVTYADAIYDCTAPDGMNDDVHPNDIGCARIAAALLPFVQTAIARTV